MTWRCSKSGGCSCKRTARRARSGAWRIALTGLRNPPFWSGDEREAKFDVFDLKGLLEGFLEQFGLRGVTYARRAESTALFLESATVQLGKNTLGEFGQLSPAVAKQYDLRDAVLLAELNLDLVLSLARRSQPDVQAAAGVSVNPARRGDAGAGGDDA